MPDNTSWQDRQTNNLTLEELRQWRIDSTKDVTDQRKHASTQNRYIKETIKDLESGERITTKKLEKLVAAAKNRFHLHSCPHSRISPENMRRHWIHFSDYARFVNHNHAVRHGIENIRQAFINHA